MLKKLSPKQIANSKRSHFPVDHTILDRAGKRAELEDEVQAFLRAGGKVKEIPIGASGIKGHVFAQYAKGQKNGLRQIVIRKER